VFLLLAGCFWHTYGRMMATHVDVLVGIARKGADLVESGRFTAESMPELTYPLERAQGFVATAHARGTTPPSLAAFEVLLARYRAFVDTLDRVRRDSPADARAALVEPLAAVEQEAGHVREALRAEGRIAASDGQHPLARARGGADTSGPAPALGAGSMPALG
jgi:hypothetical protein